MRTLPAKQGANHAQLAYCTATLQVKPQAGHAPSARSRIDSSMHACSRPASTREAAATLAAGSGRPDALASVTWPLPSVGQLWICSSCWSRTRQLWCCGSSRNATAQNAVADTFDSEAHSSASRNAGSSSAGIYSTADQLSWDLGERDSYSANVMTRSGFTQCQLQTAQNLYVMTALMLRRRLRSVEVRDCILTS